jgi:hypothetical protein
MRGTASGLEVGLIMPWMAVPTGPAREHVRRDRASVSVIAQTLALLQNSGGLKT